MKIQVTSGFKINATDLPAKRKQLCFLCACSGEKPKVQYSFLDFKKFCVDSKMFLELFLVFLKFSDTLGDVRILHNAKEYKCKFTKHYGSSILHGKLSK